MNVRGRDKVRSRKGRLRLRPFIFLGSLDYKLPGRIVSKIAGYKSNILEEFVDTLVAAVLGSSLFLEIL